MKDNINQDKLHMEALTVSEHVEDIVEHICDEYKLSGEKVWVMIRALSDYKLNDFPED